ncbi:MAG: hypothetical protein KAH20_15595 [Methylococcales bacterium]|nr:hypothetical protein [Methylococcales bacterium]
MFQRFALDIPKKNTSIAVTETIVITILSLVFGYLLTPDSGTFTAPSYSSLLIGPLLIGLRYGFAYALNSALFLIAGMWVIAQYYSIWKPDVFSSAALGLVIIPVIVGEFRNQWERKITLAQTSLSYVDHRLGEVSNAFNILKISHERLAQRTASQSTLRDNIISVRAHIMKANLTDTKAESLNSLILKLFADYCSIQQAGIFAVNGFGQVSKSALAFYGGQFDVHSNDLVLKKTLKTLETISLKPELATQEKYSKIALLAIPLVDVFGRVWAVVVVNKMPYRAFRPDNIRLFAILGGYIADLLGKRQDSYFCENIDLQAFVLHFKRCINNLKDYSIPSCLAIIQMNNENNAAGISDLILERQRGLDKTWTVKSNGKEYFIFVLLPLAEIKGTFGYKSRLEQIIKENYHYPRLDDAGIKFYKKKLDNKDNVKEIMLDYFNKFDIDQAFWRKNGS